MLAGEFTQNSLNQLLSVGFKIVYLPYKSVVDAFSHVGIDASFDEQTPDTNFAKCIDKIEALSPQLREDLKKHLLDANKAGFDIFFTDLKRKLDRLVKIVVILPLFGSPLEYGSIEDALTFISDFEERVGRSKDYLFKR